MKKIRTIIIVVLLGIGGVFGLLYTQIWNPSWNPFRPVPTIVLAKMALKMKGIKTFHVEGNINAGDVKKTSYEYKDKENISFNESKNNFKFSLDVDKNDPKSQNNYLVAEGESYRESQYGNSTSSYDSSGKIELKKIGDLIYFILTDTSKDKKLTKNTNELFLDQWIKFNQEDIGDLANLWLGELGGEINIKIPKEKQEELIKEIVKLFIGRNLFEAKEELPDEKINGQMNYHYSLVLNEKETKRLVSDIVLKIAEFISDSVSVSESTSSGDYQREYLMYLPMAAAGINMGIQKGIGDFFEQMKGVNIEIWVGQKDSYLNKIKFERDVDLVSYFEKERSESSNEKILEAEKSVLVDINFSEFNKPIEIKPPENVKDLKEILNYINQEREKERRDSQRENDIYDIYYAMRSYYSQNKEYFQSKNLPKQIETKYNVESFSQDPGNGPCLSYQWISNIGYPQQYCVWACLESGEFFAANEIRTKLLDKAPTSLSECKSLFSVRIAPDCNTYCNSPDLFNPPTTGIYCMCGI